MSLTKTESFLLYNLIRTCIDRKKPVGSKLLAKKIKNRLSPPSLRIHLRKLVKNGYIENIALTGRLPTDKGWYYYLKNYYLNPEIKIPDNFNIGTLELLELISELTKNVVFFFENKFIIKGLKNALLAQERELAEDWLNLSESLEKLIINLDKEINVLIGAKIKESKTKKLSLIAYRDQKRIFGFLGPKINYYHTNLVLLKKLIKND